MAKAEKPDGVPVVNPAVEPLTLDEFCISLSSRDKRVELIGAFNFVETQAKRFKDAESNYQSRFEAFVNQPV